MVIVTNSVPNNNISVIDRTISFRPRLESVIAMALVHIFTTAIKLVGIIWSHPNLILNMGVSKLQCTGATNESMSYRGWVTLQSKQASINIQHRELT
jgi:hypothetical protein